MLWSAITFIIIYIEPVSVHWINVQQEFLSDYQRNVYIGIRCHHECIFLVDPIILIELLNKICCFGLSDMKSLKIVSVQSRRFFFLFHSIYIWILTITKIYIHIIIHDCVFSPFLLKEYNVQTPILMQWFLVSHV